MVSFVLSVVYLFIFFYLPDVCFIIKHQNANTLYMFRLHWFRLCWDQTISGFNYITLKPNLFHCRYVSLLLILFLIPGIVMMTAYGLISVELYRGIRFELSSRKASRGMKMKHSHSFSRRFTPLSPREWPTYCVLWSNRLHWVKSTGSAIVYAVLKELCCHGRKT